MKKIIVATVLTVWLASAAGANEVRFWLSKSRVDPGFGVNPELSCEPSMQKLYLWAQPEPDDKWIGVSMFADFAPDDTAELVAPSGFFMLAITTLIDRWHPDSDLSFVGDYYLMAAAVTETGFGGPYDPPDVDGAYLLGRLTIHCLSCEPTEIYFSVGSSGIARAGALPGEDDIYFGWGDDPVSSIDTHIWTALPEAIVCAPIPPYAGDVNCDGTVDFFDIDAFILAYYDAAGYEAAYPDCDIQRADCNYDGVIDYLDILEFITFITVE